MLTLRQRLAEDSDIEFGASLKELGEIRVVIVAGVHGKSNVEHHRHTMPTVGEVDERRKKVSLNLIALSKGDAGSVDNASRLPWNGP